MSEKSNVTLSEHEAEIYDRQIRLWGLESQKRIRESNVLICGMCGVAAEVAKNIILAGVKSVTFLDDKDYTELDLSSQFLLTTNESEENRAAASLLRARALNPLVKIIADKDSLIEKDAKFFWQFDVVVVTGAPDSELRRINKICREKKVKFFATDVWGMYGCSFSDLQEHSFVVEVKKHKVISKPNEKVKTELITSSVKRKLKFPPYEEVISFNYKSPSFSRKLKRSGPAYVVSRILQKFREVNGRDPLPDRRESDIKKLLKIRDEMSDILTVPNSCFDQVFGQISPVAAIFGGQLSQEIIKTVSNNGEPHLNVFLFDPDTCCGYIEQIPDFLDCHI